MSDHSADVIALERRIEYLSVQVERLIDLQNPFPGPMTVFRKAALLTALTFEQEVLARKLLGAVQVVRNGEKVDIGQGLLPFPAETVSMFNEYAIEGTIDSVQTKNLLKTFVPGGDAAAQNLIEAWETAQAAIRRSDHEAG
ncbi:MULTISPECIES: hypothetical protein [Corynebacterium]|uniref:hypothetical protein n=1 Tax=Corynebacterium TaxID=1716 RepID=UPI0008A631CF|nr:MULTISPECIES: hypothetical protein [Corynebacterium]MCX2164201.1 hypothetical protein [Corynebacterium auriscanis]OFT91815.1 hypothetical protein HMPREF3098_00085 [Corynebacterium sp. HMSC28B08]